jgi:GGDEF domain-containing protein
MTGLRAILAIAAPAVLLVVAFGLATRPERAPPALITLLPQLPYVAMVVAAALGLIFHRGRVVFTAIALGVAYAAFGKFAAGGATDLSARAVFAALCVLAPAVIALLAWMEERGTPNVHALPRLALIAAAGGLPVWLVATERTGALEWVYAPLADVALPIATPIPQLGLAAFAVSFVAVVAAAAIRHSVVIVGLAWSLVALAFALHASAELFAFPSAITAAGVVLALVVLVDTYQMAFRDELTGLPGRRALNDTLKATGRRYAIAMIDVDRFKDVNDAHGHLVGDEVLRMVASRLARVGGGGRVFRYGGEEFTVVFSRKDASDAVPHLKALRADIEGYRLAIRAPDRPAKPAAGRRRRVGEPSAKTLSVTVSIGVAARESRNDSPEAVIAAADAALYRAKQEGRNRVRAIKSRNEGSAMDVRRDKMALFRWGKSPTRQPLQTEANGTARGMTTRSPPPT